MMATWEDVHTGDTVRGYDNRAYGVVEIILGDPRGPVVTLYRNGVTLLPAQPPPGTPIIIEQRADLTSEAAAFGALAAAGLAPELLGETFTP